MSDEALLRLQQENEWRRLELRRVSSLIEEAFPDQEGVRLEQQVRNLIKKYKELKSDFSLVSSENYEEYKARILKDERKR